MSDVLDAVLLAELKDLMAEEFPSLLETFLEDAARHFAGACAAWEDTDFTNLRISAHSLRGSSGNVGATSLQAACEVLEESARDTDGTNIDAQLAAVKTQIDNAREALLAHR